MNGRTPPSARLVLRVAPYGALLLFWGVGLCKLGQASLWYDEIFNADLVLGHTVGGILHVLRTQQPYPPLYPLMMKAWSLVAAMRAYAPGLEVPNGLEQLLRFPSVTAWALVLATVVALLRFLRLRGAVVIPFLLAVHPLALWYARDGRLYAWWTLWLMLALLALVEGRRTLWLVAASAALLTHYFSLFPLLAAALAGLTLRRPGWGLAWLCLPFVPVILWGLWALPVTAGFRSVATGSPPSVGVVLAELGPGLLSAGEALSPLSQAAHPAFGYGLLVVGALGLVLLAWRDPNRGAIPALAFGLGTAGLVVFWQARPVCQVRYLVWTLPLVATGLTVAVERSAGWVRGTYAWGLLAILSGLGLFWEVGACLTLWHAPRTVWYPDYRSAVAFLNARAREGDRGLAVAAHGVQTFTAYRSTVPFMAGPEIGQRLTPREGVRLLEGIRPAPHGRWWLLLFQDEAVDPGGVVLGTLEAAGGYRVEMLYSRELRLYAYALPAGADLQPLVPERALETFFANGIALRGLAVHREGRLLVVYLFWQLHQPQTEPLVGTVHLAHQAGEPPIAQQDKPILNAYWPLPRLPVGEPLSDRYELILPPELPAGTYRLLAAVYDPETGERCLLTDGSDLFDLGMLSLVPDW